MIVNKESSKFDTNNNPIAEKASISPAEKLPQELIEKILELLSPDDLARASRLCTNWNAIVMQPKLWQAINLREVFPTVTFFLQDEWRTFCNLTGDPIFASLSVDVSDPDKREVIKAIWVKLNPGKEYVFWLRLPNLTMRMLIRLGMEPLKGNGLKNVWIDPRVVNTCVMDEASPEVAYILSETTVQKEDIENTYEAGDADVAKYPAHQVAEIIETLALPILMYVSSEPHQKRLLSYKPLAYSRFPNKEGWYLIVGNNALNNIFVLSSANIFENKGVLVIQKFRPFIMA